MSDNILIVDDESDIRMLIQGILEDEGYSTRMADGAKAAYAAIEDAVPSLIILDIWLQGSEHDGLQILKSIKEKHPHIPVIMISGHGTIDTAVSAIRDGAYDFIEKPFKSDRLILMIKRALEAAALRRENETLKLSKAPVVELIGQSAPIQALRSLIERVSKTNSRVLITGEAGTGKDVVGHMICALSDRAHKPFVRLNCATLRPDRLEMELFGALHGARGDGASIGLLEQANGGTLFLDEVADMPLETQGKFLRVLQDNKFQKIGESVSHSTDIRFIASSNRDLEEAIKNGDFREDLYYRLNVVPIHVAALRDRLDDIPLLVEYFSSILSKHSGMSAQTFSQEAIDVMKRYRWPGNVRQLKNTVEWTAIMNGADVKMIEPQALPPEIQRLNPSSAHAVSASDSACDIRGAQKNFEDLTLKQAREIFEREYLCAQLERFDGNISKMAAFVGMERSALHRKLKSLNISASGRDTDDDTNQNDKKRA